MTIISGFKPVMLEIVHTENKCVMDNYDVWDLVRFIMARAAVHNSFDMWRNTGSENSWTLVSMPWRKKGKSSGEILMKLRTSLQLA